MENENEDVQVDVVEQEEQTSEEVESLEEETQEEESITLTKSEFNKLKRKAIAYDSKKEEVKSEPQKVVTQKPQSSSSPDELIDIKVLQSLGTPQDEIDYLKKIARVNGTSIIDAKQDDLYKAYVSKKQAEEKAQKASLGVSRGAGKKEPEKTTGLTKEEHKEIWKKATGLNA